MNKPSLILFIAAILQLQMLSQATIIKANNDEKASSSHFDCLPESFKLTDVVSYGQKRKGSDEDITIKDKLVQIKARCKGGKLLDGKGKEIKFFKFSCFGNPPIDYDEIMQKEREEFDKLKKDYTVIVVECDPRIN